MSKITMFPQGTIPYGNTWIVSVQVTIRAAVAEDVPDLQRIYRHA